MTKEQTILLDFFALSNYFFPGLNFQALIEPLIDLLKIIEFQVINSSEFQLDTIEYQLLNNSQYFPLNKTNISHERFSAVSKRNTKETIA